MAGEVLDELLAAKAVGDVLRFEDLAAGLIGFLDRNTRPLLQASVQTRWPRLS